MSSFHLGPTFMADNCNRRCKAQLGSPQTKQLAGLRPNRLRVFYYSIYYNFYTTNLLVVLAFSVIFLASFPQIQADSLFSDGALDEKVESCEACRILVDSFNKGMKDTERGKHEGGDTRWEEKNLKSYADSELRLVEIQENLCKDVKAGKAQCLTLLEEAEADIENWWFKERPNSVDIFEYLCINKQQRCCPEDTFGPNCQVCTANCNNRGTCDGAGTREGTGKCNCYMGYQGEECNDCAPDHYKLGLPDQFKCLRCHSACSTCTGPTQKNCTTCREGYYHNHKEGCIDVDECQLNYLDAKLGQKRICKPKTYCVNTDGSYRCDNCHAACSECTEYGPHSCLTCAEGYRFNTRDVCVPNDRFDNDDDDDDYEGEYSDIPLSKFSAEARIISYLGVWVLSMVFLRNNTPSMVLWTVFTAAMVAYYEYRSTL